jgi:hypothetical protein
MTHRGNNYNLNHEKGSTPKKTYEKRDKSKIANVSSNASGNVDGKFLLCVFIYFLITSPYSFCFN